ARRYERAVYATALRRLGDHAEAQEVCQEVLVRAMQKISQLREPEAFGAWLQAVTNRMAINRAVRKRAAVPTQPETLAPPCGDAADGGAGARAPLAGPRGPGPPGRARPRYAGGVLRPRAVAGRDERGVPLAGRHDQAASARGAQAPGQGAGGNGCRLTCRAGV